MDLRLEVGASSSQGDASLVLGAFKKPSSLWPAGWGKQKRRSKSCIQVLLKINGDTAEVAGAFATHGFLLSHVNSWWVRGFCKAQHGTFSAPFSS